jgi:hypothetical protein
MRMEITGLLSLFGVNGKFVPLGCLDLYWAMI